ncbi:MAG: PD40 domain-containing protein [Candidatus Krumholzibacteria bacterium]|nr:PD40 domain-containing protein [Candidatus Krumholzibacteria bacterium]
MPKVLTVIVIILLAGALVSPAAAQYPFGKNKIQYIAKDWRVIETEHSEIFYYPEESALAQFVSGFVEDVYDEYSDYFDLEFDRKIPIILYGTHHDFKETNVIPYMVSEGTGGFTEFIKGRVALPFMGSYSGLKAVFRHEMVHVFMLEKLRSVMNLRRRYTYMHPPLWFTEGLAEFLAHGAPDTEADMFIRDAVTYGNLYSLQDLWRILGTYMMYKEGESALHYIAGRFGHKAVRMILENWWKSDKFDFVLEKTIGLKEDELDRDWQEYLRKKHYPSIMTRRRVGEITEQISPDEWSFENHPVMVRGDEDGEDRVFCLGFGLGSVDLFELVKNKKNEWKRRSIIRGGRSDRFESIPILRSSISAIGDTLLFVSKSGERDVIYLYDTTDEKVVTKIDYDKARIINSPAMSHDRRSIVFSAIGFNGRTDLFVHDLSDGSFRRLTDDYHEETTPRWLPGSDTVIFSSDRRDLEPGDKRAIYSIDINTGVMRQVTRGEESDTDPNPLQDGSGFLFSSDRSGTPDIYLMSNGIVTRQTNVLGGAFGPCPSHDGRSFVMASYSGGTYHIYRGKIRKDNHSRPEKFEDLSIRKWEPSPPDTSGVYQDKDYRVRFGVDLIAAAFAVDPDYGYMGNGAQIFLTDVMGDHQLVFLFGSASDDFSNFWENLNLGFTYVNRTRRLNYALGAFHLASYIGSVYDIFRFERRYGVMGGLSYPFSKFRRVDLQTVFKFMERDDDITNIGLQDGRTKLLSNYLSFTSDNIVWGIGGPFNGHRMNVSIGRSFDLDGSRYESTTLSLDLRNYFNFGRRVVFAQRFVSRNAWGSDIQLFYLGGSWDLRGYNFRQYAGKRTLLVNNEIRFPLLDGLIVRLPFGTIEFPLFRGSLFLDAGKVEGFVMDTDWLGSIGTGVEMNLGYLPVIRVNFVRKTDFRTIDDDTRIDVFLGFNF